MTIVHYRFSGGNHYIRMSVMDTYRLVDYPTQYGRPDGMTT